LRQTLYAKVGVNGKQGNILAMKWRGGFDQCFAAQHGMQMRHGCARKGIDLGMVFTESDAVKEEKEDFHDF
jgi:hypothetical protein